jgi:hypothetical protein
MTETDLVSYLNEGAEFPVSVKLTRNRVSMLSVVFGADDAVRVRMHEEFLKAPESVLRALRAYLRTRRRKPWALVARYAQGIAGERPVSRLSLKTMGKFYDLAQVMAQVNAEFFNGAVKCRIGWGKGSARRKGRKRSRSIRYGSWNAQTRTVKIHPCLDSPSVPPRFISYIVFHEMLHAVVPAERSRGRRRDHTAQFKALEKRFPDLDEMQRLCKQLLDRLE